jgi:CubicO group peptidase (beta-lactamase class C family)
MRRSHSVAFAFFSIPLALVACSADSSAPAVDPIVEGGDASTEDPPDVQPEGKSDVQPEGQADGSDGADPRFAALEARIQSEMKSLGAPGAAVAVLEGGKVTYARGFGVKRPDKPDPVLPTTLFRIGSTTKMMTATALLQLVVAGDVDLQQPVPTYVPGFHFTKNAGWAPSILGRHLLTHQSAMLDYLEIDWADHDDSAISYLEGSQFAGLMYLMAPAGRFWNYSNPNFMIAGLMAERVTGTAYPQLMRDKVWHPLGMDRTFLKEQDVIADGDFAWGKTVDWNTGTGEVFAGPADYDNPWARPAGYAWSSVLDLVKFADFLLHGNDAVLPASQREAMQTAQVNTHEYLDLYWYGYGLFVEEGSFLSTKYYKLHAVEHGGDIPGFAANLFMVPSKDLAIAVLANTDAAHLEKSIGVALETLGGLAPSASPEPDVQPSKFADYAGEYLDKYNVGTLLFTTDGTDLFVSAPDLEKYGIGYEKTLNCYVRDTCLMTIYQGGQTYKESVTFILDQQGRGEFARTRIFVATRVPDADGGTPDAGSVPPPDVPPAPDVQGLLSKLRMLEPIPAVGLPDL